jgi:UvrD-like helicase C-terminal domain
MERIGVLERAHRDSGNVDLAPYAGHDHGVLAQQGSTFGNVFIDVPDIRKAEAFKPREMLQLCYVGLTRASRAAVLTGI